jgi:hypothetical protein
MFIPFCAARGAFEGEMFPSPDSRNVGAIKQIATNLRIQTPETSFHFELDA